MIVSAIIPVAGQGKRFGGETPKQFMNIGGKPIIEITLQKFVSHNEIKHGVVAVSENEMKFSENIFQHIDGFDKKFEIIIGGKERQDSVINGLDCLPPNTDIVVVHDGVRPLVSPQLISLSIKTAFETGACVAALPLYDTIKRVENDTVLETIPRENLWQVQTPQSFKYSVLKEALEKARNGNFYSTDESSLVELNGHPVKIILGEYHNVKITTKADLKLSQLLYKNVW